MRTEFVVTECEFRDHANLKPTSIAIVPWRRTMNRYVYFQIKLGDAAKIFFQDCGLGLQLMLVADVLIVAAAAVPEVRTIWLYPPGRSLQNRLQPASGKTAPLFEQRSFDAFAVKDKGYEYRFAGTVFIRRQPCQSVTAVY